MLAALALCDASALDLLGRLGQELPGVLSLLPEDARPEFLQTYRPLSFETLSTRLRSQQPLLVSNDQTTMSLAGAQEKMGLRWDAKKGALSESVGPSLTTHILKPDTRQPRYQPSAINEYACMQLARALKLPVPDVWLLRVPEAAYVVQRYDRVNMGATSRACTRSTAASCWATVRAGSTSARAAWPAFPNWWRLCAICPCAPSTCCKCSAG